MGTSATAAAEDGLIVVRIDRAKEAVPLEYREHHDPVVDDSMDNPVGAQEEGIFETFAACCLSFSTHARTAVDPSRDVTEANEQGRPGRHARGRGLLIHRIASSTRARTVGATRWTAWPGSRGLYVDMLDAAYNPLPGLRTG